MRLLDRISCLCLDRLRYVGGRTLRHLFPPTMAWCAHPRRSSFNPLSTHQSCPARNRVPPHACLKAHMATTPRQTCNLTQTHEAQGALRNGTGPASPPVVPADFFRPGVLETRQCSHGAAHGVWCERDRRHGVSSLLTTRLALRGRNEVDNSISHEALF